MADEEDELEEIRDRIRPIKVEKEPAIQEAFRLQILVIKKDRELAQEEENTEEAAHRHQERRTELIRRYQIIGRGRKITTGGSEDRPVRIRLNAPDHTPTPLGVFYLIPSKQKITLSISVICFSRCQIPNESSSFSNNTVVTTAYSLLPQSATSSHDAAILGFAQGAAAIDGVRGYAQPRTPSIAVRSKEGLRRAKNGFGQGLIPVPEEEVSGKRAFTKKLNKFVSFKFSTTVDY